MYPLSRQQLALSFPTNEAASARHDLRFILDIYFERFQLHVINLI